MFCFSCRPDSTSDVPLFGPDAGFFKLSTDSYNLWYLESQTGYKFVLAASFAAGDLRRALWTIYSELFLGFALKNPFYKIGTPIDNIGFHSSLDGYIRNLPGFRSAQ